MKITDTETKAWQAAVASGATQSSLESWALETREKEIASLIPAPPSGADLPPIITLHDNHVGIRYRRKYPDRYPFMEALAFMECWQDLIIPAQLWGGHSLHSAPVEINSEAARPSSVLEGEVYASVNIKQGRGFVAHTLQWWAKIGDRLFSVSVEIYPEPGWLPEIRTKYEGGEALSSTVEAKSLGEDKLIKWWTSPGGCQLQYTWADVHNWNAFTSSIIIIK